MFVSLSPEVMDGKLSAEGAVAAADEQNRQVTQLLDDAQAAFDNLRGRLSCSDSILQ